MTVEEVILKTFHTAPLLFVGSGLTRRYCGTPDWKGLLKKLAHVVMPDRAADFAYGTLLYEAKKQLSEYDREAEESECLPLIAEMIKDRFDAMFYRDPKSVGMSYDEVEGVEQGASAFLSYLSRIFSAVKKRTDLPPDLQEEISDLTVAAKHSVDGVITTNYDGFIEGIFKDFDIYVGQDDLLTKQPTGYMEIYKIHGCHTRPSSLVFTKKSYERHRRNGPYLYAKLLTFFVEHPVLFLGYSMSDPDIDDMFESLYRCLTHEQYQAIVEKMIFVEYDPNAVEPTFSDTLVRPRKPKLRTHCIRCNSFLPIFKALIKVKHQYDVRLLRRIRKDLYATVVQNTPEDCVKVISSAMLERDSAQGEVMGFTRSGGNFDVSSDEIYEHALLQNKKIEIVSFVETMLPAKMREGKLYPAYYYICEYLKTGKRNLPPILAEYMQKYQTLDSLLRKDMIDKRSSRKYSTIAELKADSTVKDPYSKIAIMDERELQGDVLRRFLVEELKNKPAHLKTYKSDFKRLIRIYDLLTYKSAALQQLEGGTGKSFTPRPKPLEKVRPAGEDNPEEPRPAGTGNSTEAPSGDMLP